MEPLSPAGELSTLSDWSQTSRTAFREFFQPSRITIALVPSSHRSGFNPITICFSSWAAYRPRMISVAIQSSNLSYELFYKAAAFTLSVPGLSLLEETMLFGTTSGRDIDKLGESAVPLADSESLSIPVIGNAVAALELTKSSITPAGDHIVVIGKVEKLRTRRTVEPNLLSVGANSSGYKVLARHGQHRIGIPEALVP